MHRSTITTIVAVVLLALSVGGATDAASAAVSHHPPRVIHKVRGSASNGSAELNRLCSQYANLIDEALDGQQRDITHHDDAGAQQWRDLATQVVNGGRQQGCSFQF